jgi:hypothetical protein
VLRYDVEPDWVEPLGLPPAPPRHERGRAQIAAIAIDKASDPRPWISYSRNKNHFLRRGTRYDEHPELYRYSIIPRAVDALAAADFLENNIAPRNPHGRWQSVFRATPALIAALGATPPPRARQRRRALLQLRDDHGQLIDFDDTERTHRMRSRVAIINEALSSIRLQLPADIGERRSEFVIINGCYVNLGQNTLWRIFNGDFQHGGRFYGAGFQSLPKELRQNIRINSEPVTEPDYPAHHLRFEAYRCTVTTIPYDVDGFDRRIVKRTMLILINAPNRQSAIGAIVHDPELGLSRNEAGRLLDELRAKHKLIESYFHSNAGCRLQRLDSDMVEFVLLGLFMRQGVPALPIHDSFVVPRRYEDAAREQMAEAFETVISRVQGVPRITKQDQMLKRKTTYTMVAGALSSSSPRAMVIFDTGRRMTLDGRMAMLQAIRCRDIRQYTLADLVGIRRSTLSNILSGRFGASKQTADLIEGIIATTPAFERQPFLPGLAA